MFKPTVLILLTLLAVSLKAQNRLVIYEKVKTIDADALGNLYTINGSVLKKFNNQGALLHQYSKSVNGFITSIDVTQPMRILVFYAESNMVQFLDHQLTELGSAIYLSQLCESNVEAVCSSSEGGFWLFENLSYTLQHVSASRVIDHKSESLSTLIGEQTLIHLTDSRQKIYVNLTHKILTFDAFGTYLGAIPIESETKPHFSYDWIFAFANHQFMAYNQKTKTDEVIIQTSNNQIKNILKSSSMYYYHYPDSVVVEKIMQ